VVPKTEPVITAEKPVPAVQAKPKPKPKPVKPVKQLTKKITSPKKGSLQITSSPPFARIKVNNKHWGETPMRKPREIPPGTHKIDIIHKHFPPHDTIVKVKNGELLIVGGLIDNASTFDNDYVAGLGEIPIAGKAFRDDGTTTRKKELVILLRPRIISLYK